MSETSKTDDRKAGEILKEFEPLGKMGAGLNDHTPTPWQVMKREGKMHFGYRIVNPAGDAECGNWTVAEKVPWKEDAAFIVRAANAHNDLLAACKAMVARMRNGHTDLSEAAFEMEAAIAKAEKGQD